MSEAAKQELRDLCGDELAACPAWNAYVGRLVLHCDAIEKLRR